MNKHNVCNVGASLRCDLYGGAKFEGKGNTGLSV